MQDCTSYTCPVYPERPVTAEEANNRKEEKIAAMTPEERKKYEKRSEAARIRLANSR